MTVKISSLRVVADADTDGYVKAMVEKVAADRKAAASSADIGAALARLDAYSDKAGGAVARLSRQMIEGYSKAAQFEKSVRNVGLAIGKDGFTTERAAIMLDNLYRQYGRTADAALLTAKDMQALKPVVEELNKLHAEQTQLMAKQTAESERLAQAEQARIMQGERVQAYLAKVDPAATAAAAAQAKFNQELENAEDLYTASLISLDRYRAGVSQAQNTFDAAMASARKMVDAQRAQAQTQFNSLLGVRDSFSTADRGADMEAALRGAEVEAKKAAAAIADVQRAYNSLLGVRDDFDTDKRAADIAAWSREYDTYLSKLVADRQEEQKLAAQRAASAQAKFNDLTGVRDFGTDNRAADILALGESIEATRMKYDQLYAVTKRYQDALDEINRTPFMAEEKAVMIENVTRSYEANTRLLGVNSAAVGLNRHQWMNLSHQLNDVATMLASGSSPFQVMATQSGQVFQILQTGPGGVVGSLKSIGSTALGLVTPLRLVAGGMGAIGITAGVMAYQAVADFKVLEASIQGIGRQSGLTVGQLQAAVEATSALPGVSNDMAIAMAAAYAKTGKVGKDVITDLMSITRDYAVATGKDMDAAAAFLGKAFSEPAKGMRDLDAELGYLDLTTRRHIQTLVSQNRRSEAQHVLFKAISDDIPKARDRLTLLGRAWEDITSAADNANDRMGQALGRLMFGPTMEKKIADAERIIEDIRNRLANGENVDGGQDRLDRMIEKYKQLLAEQEAYNQEIEKAEQRNKANEIEDLRESLDPRIAELRELIQRQNTLKNYQDKGGDVGDLLERTKNKIEAMTKAAKDGAEGSRELLTALEQIRKEEELNNAVALAQPGSPEYRKAIADRERYQAKKEGATSAEADFRAENAVMREQIQLQQQLSQAARDRIRTIDESIAQARIEMSMVGATAEERERLTANLRAEQDLRREAAQNGTAVDLAQLAVIKAKNAELARTNALLRAASLRDDLMFDRDQMFRSGYDQQIAAALRGAGQKIDLNSELAQIMRLNMTLADTRDLLSDSFGSFTQDIMNGTDAAEAFTSVLSNISNKLISMATEQLVAEALGGLVGGKSSGGGNILGSLLSAIIPNAKGGVYSSPGLSAYSNSIVTQPTMFAFAKGTGLMGEAGPEAIMPLSRGRDGKLGVQMTGGLVGERSGGGSAPALSVNIQTLPGTTADVSEPKPDGNGGFSVDVIMRQVKAALVDDARRMGPVASAYQGRFGLNPTRGMG